MEEYLDELLGDYNIYQEDVKYIYIYTQFKEIDSDSISNDDKLILTFDNMISRQYPNYLRGSLKIEYVINKGLEISFIPNSDTYFRLIPLELIALINFNLSKPNRRIPNTRRFNCNNKKLLSNRKHDI